MFGFTYDVILVLFTVAFGMYCLHYPSPEKRKLRLWGIASLVLGIAFGVVSFVRNFESPAPQPKTQAIEPTKPVQRSDTIAAIPKPDGNPDPRGPKPSEPQQGGFSFTSDALMFVIGSNSIAHNREHLLKGRRAALFVLSGDTLAVAYIDKSKLFVDFDLPGLTGPSRSSRRLSIRHNSIVKIPPLWDFNYNDFALEIVDDNKNVMLQLIYKLDNYITLNCKVEKAEYVNGELKTMVMCVDGNGIHPARSVTECNLPRMFKYPFESHKHETVD